MSNSDYRTVFQGNPAYDTHNISATGAWLSWSVDGKQTQQWPLLLSQINMTFSRSIQPIYPVNSAQDGTFTKIQILGAPQGTLQCTGIVTPKYDTMVEFLEVTGAGCSQKNVVVDFKPFSNGSKCNNKFGYRMTGLTMQTIGFSVQGNEVAIISQPLAFTFTGLQLENIRSDYR